MLTTLYKISATKNVQIWEIEQVPKYGKLCITWGIKHGAMQYQTIAVTTNQSGRSLAEQCCLEADSRINKQLDKGYCHTIEEAKLSIGMNASKLPKPMLAVKYRDVNVDHKKCFFQYKYNGHRCLIAMTDTGIIGYSRNGKPIPGIDHILCDLENRLPVGTCLDGELYVHNKPLQEIGSLIRKKQVESADLRFICYDQILNKPYGDRLESIHRLDLGSYTKIAPTEHGKDIPVLHEAVLEAISKGYEGGMLRTLDKGYESKRSKQLIKLKIPDDCEVVIVDVLESADGWAIFKCMTLDQSRTFRVSAPGTIEEKIHALHNPHLWLGQLLTIEHFGFTSDRIPFHPIAIGLREDIWL